MLSQSKQPTHESNVNRKVRKRKHKSKYKCLKCISGTNIDGAMFKVFTCSQKTHVTILTKQTYEANT